MDQNNNDYNGPKTLFLSGKFYYEPNKEKRESSEAPSSNGVNCTVCYNREKQVHSLNTSPTGSQTAQNEPTMQPDATFMHPCSIGMQSICRFCCMRSSFGMQSPCCMHPDHSSCCLHNCFTKYACTIHFPNAPCMQSHCGTNCSSGIRCRMQNPWGGHCGVHSPCWVPSGCFHSPSDIQGSLGVNKTSECQQCQTNRERNSPMNKSDSLTLDSLHICGSPIDTQDMNNQVTQKRLITTVSNSVNPPLPQKTMDFPQKYNDIEPPNAIDGISKPTYLPSRVTAESSELHQNESTEQNEQNIANSVIERLPIRSPNEERIDNNLDEKHQMQNKVQNDNVLSGEMDKKNFSTKDFLPSKSSIEKIPRSSTSLDDLREKLQTVFQNKMSSENGTREVKPSKDFCQIAKSSQKPPIIQTELKNQQNENAYKNFPGNNVQNEVKRTKTDSIVSEEPPVQKGRFKILKIVEYIEPVQKEMAPPSMTAGRFQVSKVIENNLNEKSEARIEGRKMNQINNQIEAVSPVAENRYNVTSVNENENQHPVKELAQYVAENRCNVPVDENGNELPVKELARFYMCKIDDQNGNKPQMEIMQVPIIESRLKMYKANEELGQSENCNGENMETAENWSPLSSKRSSLSESPLFEQLLCSIMDDQSVLFQELSAIMNEAQTWSGKLDEIESNDKLEKGAISHRAVEIKKNRTVWLNLMKLRQTLDPSYYEPTPKDYDCDIRVRLYAFLRKSFAEVHFNSFYMIAKLKEHENVDPNSKFGISLRTDCIQKLVDMRKKLDACEEALKF